MPKVNITSTEQKTSKAGKTYYVVTLDDGSKAVSWDASIMGKTGEIEAEIIEKYDDLGNLRRTLKLPGSAGERKPWGGGRSQEERDEIMKQSSAKTAFDFGGRVGLSTEQCFTIANEIFEWVKGKAK